MADDLQEIHIPGQRDPVYFPKSMSDDDIAKAIQKEFPLLKPKSEPVKIGKDAFPDALRQTLKETDWGTRNIAAAGTALSNLWEGAKQIVTGKGDDQRIQSNRIMEQEAPVGAIAGNVALLAPTAMVPGANTAAGAGVIGAITGALQPTQGDESRLKNTVASGLMGAGGQAIANKAGSMLTNKLAKSTAEAATQQATNAAQDTAIKAAKDAGYILPPSQAKPTLLNRFLEGWSGKIQTAQSASIKNQEVTNDLVRKGLGLAPDAPITKDALGLIRKQAGQDYEAVRGAGTIQADKSYFDELDKIAKPYLGASKDFPKTKPSPVIDVIDSLKEKQFDASSAIDQVRTLREEADKAFAARDKSMGRAYKQASEALENVVERHLTKSGAPKDLITNFRQARQVIAKTYSVESALTESGNVSAQKLAAQLAKDKPLSGEIKTAAKFGASFPKASQLPERIGSHPGISPLDAATAAIGGKPGLLSAIARGPVRGLITSKPYQGLMVGPGSYGPGAALSLSSQLANNPYVNRGLVGGVGELSEIAASDRREP